MNHPHIHAAPARRPRSAMTRAALAALAVASLAALGACGTTSTTSTTGAAGTPAPASSGAWGAPIRFVCNDTPPSTFVARYREPDASSMSLARGDRTAQLQRQPAASGARYAGTDVAFWEHQGEVQVQWGPNAAPLRCVRQR
jgi:membrane-bound inhibitor of C-type lysozyme